MIHIENLSPGFGISEICRILDIDESAVDRRPGYDKIGDMWCKFNRKEQSLQIVLNLRFDPVADLVQEYILYTISRHFAFDFDVRYTQTIREQNMPGGTLGDYWLENNPVWENRPLSVANIRKVLLS